ncbi:N-acetylmuramoyl-L-alanine amidase family protein [Oribacterium sp. oral taxon 102]|uniref:N-acetylmuramoyl-L-alanine amidase family protein n=1 Tax=Oribacterium sp. oral taxon 102 TaxID=671214 RepID=UPI0015B7D467|nr:N-acetylmuramoyl-L-alanine amidase family protein [Oribacterium sp. oral taxon 102]NWO21737.1 N-acetylmuramoyl-L-alanine amidase family protein [Oribacterium sp. oral taxon 102]
MRKQLWKMLALTLAFTCTMASPLAAVSAAQGSGWLQENGSWRYYSAGIAQTGWLHLGDKWYYLAPETGNMETGWNRGTDGSWYYFEPGSGAMQHGWVKDGNGVWYFLHTSVEGGKAVLLTGWQWIDGYCYYFETEPGKDMGHLYTAGMTPDHYYVNADGRWTEADGSVHYEAGKGISTAAKPATPRRAAAAASGGGSSSGGRRRRERDDSGKTDPNRPGKTSPSEIPGGKETEHGGKASDSEISKEDGVFSYVQPEDVVLDYIDGNAASYRKKLPRAVRFRMKSGRYVSLEVKEWRFSEEAAEGGTVTATADGYNIPSRYQELEAEFLGQEVSISVSFRKKQEEPTPPEELRFTGFEQPEDVSADYISNNPSDYSFFPKKIRFTLSDQRTLDLKVMSWSFETRPEAGREVTARAILDDLPSEYNGLLESFESLGAVTMRIRFNKAEETDKVTLKWDHTESTSWGSEKHSYRFDETAVLTLENYKGDGSGLSLRTGYPDYLRLTKDHGFSFDEAEKAASIRMDDLMPNELKEMLSLMVYDGETKLGDAYLTITTDRSVEWEENRDGASTVEYRDVSRKTSVSKRVILHGVTDEDAEKVRFIAGSTDVTEKLHFEKESDGSYRVSIPDYAALDQAGYISSSAWGGSTFTMQMRMRGVKPVSIRLSYRNAPALTPDKSGGYYAAEEPLLTLRNFSWDETEPKDVRLYFGEKGGSMRLLTAGQDYTMDEDKKQLRLHSAAVLGTASLSEGKSYLLRIEAAEDAETAELTLSYKKDKALSLSAAAELAPYAPIVISVSGLDGDDNPSVIRLYAGDRKLEKVRAVRNYSTGLAELIVPYEEIAQDIRSRSVTLRAVMAGAPEASVTLHYAEITEEGTPIPAAAALQDSYKDAYPLQDGLPVMNGRGTIRIAVSDRSIPEAQWRAMGVTLRKKSEPADAAFAVGIAGTDKDWSAAGTPIAAVNLEALYRYADKIGELKADEAGRYPVFTVTLYMAGYARTSFDIALKSPSY